MAKTKSNGEVLVAGVIKENPVLRLMLGTCPTLAVTTMASNAIGMGIAATLVLVGSNAVISILRNIIPDRVRIPVFITIIAGFVTLIQMLVKAFLPAIDASLGLFLPLIVVNCIILGRAESFASKNKVLPSILDGIGMGVGFTFALLLMGSVREILGAGTWFGFTLNSGAVIAPMLIFILPAGGFFVYGVLVAIINLVTAKKGRVVSQEAACAGCPMAKSCSKAVCKEEPAKPAPAPAKPAAPVVENPSTIQAIVKEEPAKETVEGGAQNE